MPWPGYSIAWWDAVGKGDGLIGDTGVDQYAHGINSNHRVRWGSLVASLRLGHQSVVQPLHAEVVRGHHLHVHSPEFLTA